MQPNNRKPILSAISTHLEPPLQYADVGVEREGLGRVLEADLVLGLEQLLVDVGVRLQLDCLVGRVLQLQPGCSQIISNAHNTTRPQSNRN